MIGLIGNTASISNLNTNDIFEKLNVKYKDNSINSSDQDKVQNITDSIQI